MWEIRFHGRGGQGAVIASKILASALFREGLYTQAFPSFGAERRGAPVAAFLRADRAPIRVRGEMAGADHLLILDVSLLALPDLLKGYRESGWIIINSPCAPLDLGFPLHYRVATVDADRIAWGLELGSRAFPIVNTAILGAFARASGLVSVECLNDAMNPFISVKPERNRKAIRQAYEEANLSAPRPFEVEPCAQG
ncbi:MAG: 2-oxoacid:acceptor oxidoreductase family protein [Candidatus Tectomicrobia bacterium]|uniref:2-oxoacid:acceptor oxidoreductase family protein n=1 Tax=Tectimicrobiota bacterium TaxID=2528274 RepID=A0A932LYV1_UNCTE|nr:2-oxoacid:acceptor oxidoreductase family protein [Candidatus Tectomicrobia bacterium]